MRAGSAMSQERTGARAAGRAASTGIALGLGWLVAACATEPLPPDPGDNVVLVTLDGLRGREVFGGPDPALSGGDVAATFPLLTASLAEGGVMYGDPARFQAMTTANQAQVSLPGYMSILTGYEQHCYDNDCPMVGVETVLEYVERTRGGVAVFASWAKMGRAIEHVVGSVTADVGPGEHDEVPGEWTSARWDRDTFERAVDYLEREQPRLLYVSLVDGDGWAHAGDYAEYLATLRRYDAWIAELRLRLAAMGEYGARTTVIVTTDHGRGDGDLWRDHDSRNPGSERVWLYAAGPHVQGGPFPEGRHSHADVRPTIEALFDLPLSACDRCGAPLAEVVGGGS